MSNSPDVATGHVLGNDPRGIEFFTADQQSRLLFQAARTDLGGPAYWNYTYHVEGFSDRGGLIVLFYGDAARLYERTPWQDRREMHSCLSVTEEAELRSHQATAPRSRRRGVHR